MGWFVEQPASTVLSESERAFVHEKTLWVLENVGVSIPSKRALDLLAKGGAAVDRERHLARLPRQLVEHCLSSAPGTVLLAARDSSHDIELGGGSRLVCCADGQGTLIADDATGANRDATVDDMRDVCRLYDALPEIDFLWTSLAAPSLDPVVAPLVVDAIALVRRPNTCRACLPRRRAWRPPSWRCSKLWRAVLSSSVPSTRFCIARCLRCSTIRT